MKSLLAIPFAVAGLAIGWFLGEPTPSTAKQSTPSAPKELGESSESASAPLEIVEIESPSTSAERIAKFEEIRLNGKVSFRKELELRLLAQKMTEEDLMALAEQADGNSYLQLLGQRWAELNPEGALQYCLSQPGREEQLGLITGQVMKYLFLADEARGMAALQMFPEDQRDSTLLDVGQYLTWTAPDLALKLIRQVPGKTRYSVYVNIFKIWADRDIEGAWAALETLPPGNNLAEAYQGIFQHLASGDPVVALELSAQIPQHYIRHNMMHTIYSQWMQRDPDAALASLASLPNPRPYLNEWTLSEKEPEKLLNFAFEHLQGHIQDEVVQQAIKGLFKQDQAAALAYIAGLPRGAAHQHLMSGVIQEWAQSNPDEALAWIQQQPDGRLKREQMTALLDHYTNTDLATAQSLFLSLDQRTQEAAVNELASALVKNNPEQGLAFLEQVTDPDIARQLERKAYRYWAQNDPAGLMEHLGAERFNALYRDDKRHILNHYADANPAQAATWLPNVEAKDYRDQAEIYGAVYFSWFRHDPLEASEYTASLERGPERDVAVMALFASTYEADPTTAFDWLPEIENDKLRLDIAKRAARNWPSGYDAKAIIEGSELSDADREALLDLLSKK
ncbi:hypothetical protein [Cerasicoccus frondis]|uniref:hypothetical protein n=1 Tax=Cerasicoccus frondis TaxID=490090 RepID=UPI002852A67A|nr:hypothetical protein [Cerasicoccus frondis]